LSSDSRVELQLVSRLGDWRAWDVCRARAQAGATVQVVLIHDAVLETAAGIQAALGEDCPNGVEVTACAADARRRRVAERWALVDYPEIIERCAAAARVTSW
jgi:hypothetical protein